MMSDFCTRILIVAVFFGKLPDYFPLWLGSCKENRSVDWLLITDANVEGLDIPANVHVRCMDLPGFLKYLSVRIGVTLQAEKPYKVCDFRPAFSALLDLVPGKWDWWGHCDIDMVFGDLRKFISNEMLLSFERIFSVGHLSLYKNSTFSNDFFRKKIPGMDWVDVFEDPAHRAYDEHMGVNVLWERFAADKFYKNESIIADIDPHVRSFFRSSNYIQVVNSAVQTFRYKDGRLFRSSWDKGSLSNEELMYIHFQKRKMNMRVSPASADYFITRYGFVAVGSGPLDRREILRLNPSPSILERMYLLRRRLRMLRKAVLGVEA